MPFDNRAIGVFDSGVGGLTAVRRLREIMPHEHIIYFGDTGRLPYGTRSAQTIVKYTRQDVAFLRQFDLKAIVVACGTVSSVALPIVAPTVPLPMIGVVEPACAAALAATKNGKIGVIATSGTIRSQSYERILHQSNPDLQIFPQACPLFVSLVENGRVHVGDVVIETVVAEYLAPLKQAGIDTLILGCTHYPLLMAVIAQYLPDVTLIDTGATAAEHTAATIAPSNPTQQGSATYYVSDDPALFNQLAPLFLAHALEEQAQITDVSGL